MLKFVDWVKAQKSQYEKKIIPSVRKMEDDLSDDYKDHLKHNGTVEPWKILPPTRIIKSDLKAN